MTSLCMNVYVHNRPIKHNEGDLTFEVLLFPYSDRKKELKQRQQITSQT